MKLQVNGEAREIMRATTISELLSELGLPPHALLVEHNGTALRPDEWHTASLSEGDRIEIVKIVAGG